MTMPSPKRGRPSKVDDPATIEQAGKLCRLFGATDAQLADYFGVTEQTINNWKTARPEFFESIKDAKEEANAQVKQALFKRATGYHRTVERLSKEGVPIALTEELPPDPTAIIFWLCNRDKENWRQKQEVEHSGKIESITVTVARKEPPKT